jgi:hypothetical protein
MTNTARNLYLSATKIDSSTVRIIVFVITLAMFVLAAGAPEAPGGGGYIG